MRGIVVALALAALACQQPSVDVPEPPDMSAVLAAYQSPSAPLNAATAAEAVAKAQPALEAFQQIGGLAPWLEAVAAIGKDSDETSSALAEADGTERMESALEAGGTAFAGDGFFTVTRICSGWAGATRPDPADGDLVLTATFSDQGFDAVVWGEARSCRYVVDGRQIAIDGRVRLHTGTLLTEQDAATELTLAFEGSITVDDRRLTVDSTLSVRLHLATGLVEIDLGVSAGNLVFVDDESAASRGFRAANGTWTCDFEKGTCTHDGDTLRLW